MTDDELVKIVTQLDPTEQFVLQWLSKTDVSPYGECSGRTLDDLIAKRLVEVKEINDRPRRTWPTRCTDLGHKVAKCLEKRIAQWPTLPG
jgi:hypothetical protein